MTKRRLLSHCYVQVLHCPDCFYMSLSLSKMGEHFFTHQESVEWQIFKCSTCGLISSHEELLDEHICLKHGGSDKAVGKKLLIDSVFIPELPESYSVELEMMPKCYRVKYICPFCDTCSTDKEVFRTHLGLSHNILNVDSLKAFVSYDESGTDTSLVTSKKIQMNSSNFDYIPDYKKLKVEETGPRMQPVPTTPNESSNNSNKPAYQNVVCSFTMVADKIVASHTEPSVIDSSKVIICGSDPDLKMEINRDILTQSYDPEPLRFLRNLVRNGIPLDELMNFSWKGNRRGRPRLVSDVSSQSHSSERKSMKDDPRMKSFCKLVEEVSKKPLPENLGTYMHQFLSNLRNKNSF